MFSVYSRFSKWTVYSVLRLPQGSGIAESADFFIYDTLKIVTLLVLITHLMSFIRYYLPVEKLKNFLAGNRLYGADYLLAAVFGVITPFCSCSSIPLFIGFVEAGIPLGVTFTFLITSPLINEIAIALFIGMFGLKITVMYIAAGLIIGLTGGYIMGRMKMEKYVEDFVWKMRISAAAEQGTKPEFGKVIRMISGEAAAITLKIIPFVAMGVAAGSLIHGFVPKGFFESYLQKAGILGVPAAVILAVPLYSNASGVIPVIQSLVAKGVPLGTSLAFMMAVVGVSFPEALILKKVLKLPLLLIFFGIVTAGIISIGYVFNLVL